MTWKVLDLAKPQPGPLRNGVDTTQVTECQEDSMKHAQALGKYTLDNMHLIVGFR